jgi:hypothetical protein
MMRLFKTLFLTMTLVLFGASSASAINVFMGAPSATTLNVGDTFSIQYKLNTEGETHITSVFTSIFADPAYFSYVSGNSPGLILFNPTYGELLSRATQPVPRTNPADPAPPGAVHAGTFATTNPDGSSQASASQLLATIVFMAIAPTPGSVIGAQPVSGDDLTVSQASVIGEVTWTDSAPITVIPEPGTALLMGLGLAGLGLAGRRNA